ncbi:MAG: DUF1778 domain-containing protein [Bifidobacteriaceae bacterium]|jgi:uncharacterized protein (DUF1778 family)|nr:DUF1778 domain-containing protein [Bifidobacteriaceae bacterium]
MTATHRTLPAKSSRINLRTTAQQATLLRQAASSSGRTLTDFVLSSAVEQAERVLAERHWFVVDDEQFEEFMRLVDRPLPSTSKFEALFSRSSALNGAE